MGRSQQHRSRATLAQPGHVQPFIVDGDRDRLHPGAPRDRIVVARTGIFERDPAYAVPGQRREGERHAPAGIRRR